MHECTRVFSTIATALFVLTATAQAQTVKAMQVRVPPCGPGTADPSCENPRVPPSVLFRGIKLTEAQQDTIVAVMRWYGAQLGEMPRGHSPLAVYHKQVLALRARERAEIRKLLTPDQLPRYDVNADSAKKVDERILTEARERDHVHPEQ